MAAIDTLFKRFDRATGDYEANVNQKKCDSKETSALYNKGVVELADGKVLNLDNLIVEFLNSLSEPDKSCPEEYSNTKGNLEILTSRINSDLEYFRDNFFSDVIKKAVEDAFVDVESKFNELKGSYDEKVKTINSCFSTYNSAVDAKNKYDRYLANATEETPPQNIASWKQSRGRADEHMRASIRTLESEIPNLENIINNMKKLVLEDGYGKVGTA